MYVEGEDRRYPLRKIIEKIITERSTIFEHKAMEVNALASIIPTAIITTNYDELLEKTFGKKYNVCIGQDIIWSRADNNSKTIYKIHGSVSKPSSIVITQEDYDNFMASRKYLYAKLMTLFWENPIVFMGYGIGDDNVKNVLGLDNYCVWGDSEIAIAFNKTDEVKALEKLDVNSMKRINEDLYIEKVYAEDKIQKRSNRTALINDMITRVTFGTAISGMMKNVDIPFFAARTRKDFYAENVKPNLSRSEVEIEGKLREDIVSYVYVPYDNAPEVRSHLVLE